MPILYVRRVVEPTNQELASTATPEPIRNNNDIIEIDEFTISTVGCAEFTALSIYVKSFYFIAYCL